MELLCLKNADSYLRITGNAYTLTTLKEASVFRVSEVDLVKNYYHSFRYGLEHLTLVKLTISEEEIKI